MGVGCRDLPHRKHSTMARAADGATLPLEVTQMTSTRSPITSDFRQSCPAVKLKAPVSSSCSALFATSSAVTPMVSSKSNGRWQATHTTRHALVLGYVTRRRSPPTGEALLAGLSVVVVVDGSRGNTISSCLGVPRLLILPVVQPIPATRGYPPHAKNSGSRRMHKKELTLGEKCP